MCLEQEESQSVIDVSDTKQNKSDSDEPVTTTEAEENVSTTKFRCRQIEIVYYFYQ